MYKTLDEYSAFPNNPSLPLDELTYEQALGELEKLVAALETQDLSLENSLALFERGQQLAKRCTGLLDQAELRVRQLVGENLVDFEG
jgi:exodeoxyribonuclease VII small subunit